MFLRFFLCLFLLPIPSLLPPVLCHLSTNPQHPPRCLTHQLPPTTHTPRQWCASAPKVLNISWGSLASGGFFGQVSSMGNPRSGPSPPKKFSAILLVEEIWGSTSWGEGSWSTIIYKVLAPSQVVGCLGFLNHQQSIKGFSGIFSSVRYPWIPMICWVAMVWLGSLVWHTKGGWWVFCFLYPQNKKMFILGEGGLIFGLVVWILCGWCFSFLGVPIPTKTGGNVEV